MTLSLESHPVRWNPLYGSVMRVLWIGMVVELCVWVIVPVVLAFKASRGAWDITNFRSLANKRKELSDTGDEITVLGTRSFIECSVLCLQQSICMSFNVCNGIYEGYPVRCELFKRRAVPSELRLSECRYYERESPCINGGEYLDADDRCKCVESYAGLTCQRIMRDCSEGHIDRYRETREFYIQPKDSPHPFPVKCNNHAAGGMTHLTFRSFWASPRTDFAETWQAYKDGFGLRYNDIWIGNEYIHQITRQGEYELEVGVSLFGEDFTFVYHDWMYIGNESERYAIHLGPYRTGNMDGDSLTPSSDTRRNINGKPFSTIDNDVSSGCAATLQAGWWFAEDCTAANLNGPMSKTAVPRLNYLYPYGNTPLQGAYMQIRAKKYYSEMP